MPWLVWLSGLSAGLRTKGLLVRFLVRAHAWVVGQVPSRGRTRGNHTLMFPSLSFYLPSPLSKNKQIKSVKRKYLALEARAPPQMVTDTAGLSRREGDSVRPGRGGRPGLGAGVLCAYKGSVRAKSHGSQAGDG